MVKFEEKMKLFYEKEICFRPHYLPARESTNYVSLFLQKI